MFREREAARIFETKNPRTTTQVILGLRPQTIRFDSNLKSIPGDFHTELRVCCKPSTASDRRSAPARTRRECLPSRPQAVGEALLNRSGFWRSNLALSSQVLCGEL